MLDEKKNLWNYKRGVKPRGWVDDGEESPLHSFGTDGNFASVAEVEVSLIYGRCPNCEQKRLANIPRFMRLLTCACQKTFLQERLGEYGDWEEPRYCKVFNRMKNGITFRQHLLEPHSQAHNFRNWREDEVFECSPASKKEMFVDGMS